MELFKFIPFMRNAYSEISTMLSLGFGRTEIERGYEARLIDTACELHRLGYSVNFDTMDMWVEAHEYFMDWVEPEVIINTESVIPGKYIQGRGLVPTIVKTYNKDNGIVIGCDGNIYLNGTYRVLGYSETEKRAC